MTDPRSLLLATLITGVTAVSSIAQTSQTVLQRVTGGQFDEWLGESICPMGDLNGDGADDYLVGAPRYATSRGEVGRVVAVSGRTGQPLYVSLGRENGARFGFSLTRMGDMTGDGIPEFGVGAPWSDRNGTNAGYVQVCCGATGRFVRSGDGAGPGLLFGYALAGVDLAGSPVLLVGAPSDRSNVNSSIRVFDPQRGVQFGAILAPPHHRLGASIALRGELVAVGAPGSGPRGEGSVAILRFLVGRPYVEVTRHLGFTAGGAMGTSVAAVDLPNGAMFLCGGPGPSTAPGQVDAIRLEGGVTRLIATYAGNRIGDGFGFSLAGGRDADGDGVEDFIVGAPTNNGIGAETGMLHFFSGATQQRSFFVFGRAGSRYGHAVAMLPDVNGDGLADLMTGAPRASVGQITGAGDVELSSVDVRGSVTRYGRSCSPGFLQTNSRGLFYGGTVRVDTRSISPAGQPAHWLIGIGRARVDLTSIGMPGCELLVQPILAVPAVVPSTGALGIDIAIPADPSLFRSEFTVQFAHGAPGANPLGLLATAGMALRIGNR